MSKEEKDKEHMSETSPEEPTKASEILLERIAKLRADHAFYESNLAPLDDANAQARQKLEEQKELYKRINHTVPLGAEPTDPLPDETLAPHMTFAAPRADAPDPAATTESLINGMIAELHMVMRAVALPSAARAIDYGARQAFLGTAMNLADMGGKLGRVVAKIRKSGNPAELRERQTYERVISHENG
jgi:hypothetical protein